MSIYKNLVNALFKLSGSQAMPSGETITVSPTANNNYIAPTDGYFTLSGESALGDGAYLQGSGSGLALITSYSQGQGARLYIPAKKGNAVYLVTSSFVSSNISFTKLVGG